jgi:glycosyltransferase involved in cell wall biosynthesis
MRVIHVVPTPFGAGGLFGGGERYPLELARALAEHVECELVSFGRYAAVEREPTGLVRRTLVTRVWAGGHPAHPLAAGLFAALSGAHLVHTHHMRSLPSRLSALAGRLRRQTVVVTDHGLQGDNWLGLLPRLFHAFLTVSAYSARELGAPSSRTRVIYGGADPLRYAPDPRVGREGALFVGRLTPHKGVDVLLRALPPGARLTVIGSAGHDPRLPEREYPRLLAELAAGREVHLAGTAPDSELAGWYRSARVLVLPSVERTVYGRAIRVSELLGLAVLEAMSSGTPVIASAVGGLPEIVQDGMTGYLVPPGDVSALHDRLALVLGDARLAARLGANARQAVLERFTWQHVAERCLAAYAAL